MPARHHSRATRLAATFLARLASPDVAAATFRVDPRTVRSWQAGAVELPDDEWEAIEAVLLARGGEMAARGDTRGLVQTLTAGGIASRNRRYATLIARREARREAEQQPEPSDPMRDAMNALTDRQRMLVSAELHAALDAAEDREEQPPEPSEEEYTASFLAYLAGPVALAPEQIAERTAAADAEADKRRAEQAQPYRREVPIPLEAAQDAPGPATPPNVVPIRSDPGDAARAWTPWARIDL